MRTGKIRLVSAIEQKKKTGTEMIMSQQSTPLEASGFGIDVARGLKTAITRAAAAFHIGRQAQADNVVRSTIAALYRDEELARFGWNAEHIRRLKSR